MVRKDKFFIAAMNAGMYRSKKWVISAFALIRNPIHTETPYEIAQTETEWVYFDPDQKRYVIITDKDGTALPLNTPPFHFTETLAIGPLDVPNANGESFKTSYGILLANFILLVYPFKDKINYINGELKIPQIESIIGERLEADHSDIAKQDPTKILISEYKEFVKAAGQLEGFAQLCVPAATEKALMTDPRVKALVAELKEKYKDSLNDPATIAKIDAEVEKMDRAWIKGDPSERYYLKDKSYAITRKKMYGLYGGEAGLGDGSTMDFIDKPLSEGLEIKSLPAMINSLRSGSYDRGTQTALGGVAVKEFFRVFQNANITVPDCGSTIGILRKIRTDNVKQFIGLYYIDNGKAVLIDNESVRPLIGTVIEMRSPATCKVPLTDYCETCMGISNSRSKTGLGAGASEIGSRFMTLMLKAFHGKALRNAKFDVIENII